MSAPHMNEERLAMFAEGRLTADESRQVAGHVAVCDPCLRIVRAIHETAAEETDDSRQRMTRWLAVAAVVTVVVIGATMATRFHRERTATPVGRLVELSPKAARLVEPRLTGGFPWAPYRGPVRAENGEISAQQMKVLGAAGDLIEQAGHDHSPDVQHAAAEAVILSGNPEAAVARLQALAAASPSNADVWSDLAAAQSAAALRLGRPSLYPEALAAADRALQLNPKHPEALFNRAVIVERLGLVAEARAAWQRYLAVDPASAWSNEARGRLSRLAGPSGSSHFERELPQLEKAALEDGPRLRELVQQMPQQIRAYAEGEYLARWGDAFLRGDQVEAERLLTVSRNVGRALVHRSGESLLADAVAAIDRADGTARATLARGHVTYRRGRITYSKQHPAEAEADLRAAASDLAAAGSPMALVARYYAANTRYDQNDVRGARAELLSLLSALDRTSSYIALRGEARWELALCDAVDADWNGAYVSLTAARDAFRRLGEQGNEAFIETLLAQALGGLGRPDEAWDARIHSFAALANAPGDRLAVSVNSAAASELRAGRRDAALALLRVFAETARTSRNDALLASALLPQTLLAATNGDTSAAESVLGEMSAAAGRIADPRLREKADSEVHLARAAMLLGHSKKDKDAGEMPALHSAEDLLSDAIAFDLRAGKPALLPEPYLLRGRTRARLGNLEGAAADLESGIGVIESQRVQFARGMIGTGVLDAGSALYAEAMALALDRGDVAAAFAYAERSRDEVEPDLHALQQRLAGTRTAVLEAASTANEIIELVITASGVDAIRRPAPRNGSTRPDDLYDLLIRPAEPLIANTEALIIVPDRALSQVPFAALYDRKTAEYLIQRHSVSVAKSASSLQLDERHMPQSAAAMMLPSGQGTGMAALPETAGELSDVCGAYAACATGRPATYAALHAAAQHADVLHLAGHTQSGGGETALVFGSERVSWRTIAATPLPRGEVVVLAACETLKSTATPDERAPSLGAAFAAAGADDVIGTLTPIADADARSLFRSIHRELAAGATPAEAVRQTQIAAIAAHDGAAWQSIAVLTRHISQTQAQRRIAWAR